MICECRHTKKIKKSMDMIIKLKALQIESIFSPQEIGLIKIYFPVYFPDYNEQGGYEPNYKKYTKLAKSIHDKCSLLIKAWGVKNDL